MQAMLIGSSLTHVECNLGGFVAQGLARVHRVLGMSQLGHVCQARSIRADVDNGSLAALFQHWQQAFCDCKCANNIDVQCLLQVIDIPVSMNVFSSHSEYPIAAEKRQHQLRYRLMLMLVHIIFRAAVIQADTEADT